MPRFVFALEPLLRARRRAEEQEQRRRAEIERERLRLQKTLRDHQRNIAQGKFALRESLTGTVDIRALRLATGASLHLVRMAQQIVLQLAGVQTRGESARARLIEASRNRRAMELLRERRHEAWKRAQEKAETAALDELATQRGAKEIRP